MKLSTKGSYSLRAMLDLALNSGDVPVLIKDISFRQGISRGYLEQLFTSLRVAGLVRGIRGARGGFILSRPPAEIKLSEIIQATEGSIAPVACVDDPRLCRKSGECITRDVWIEMKKTCDKVLESLTLQDLIERSEKKSVQGEHLEEIS
ncbi:MAG: Rrf2 family transcriptional regulator [Deltaproteobacteria bacterium]|nr:Rrf2 family transcriptional regulator [Deltaproteobacteria bacterium]